MTDHITSSIDQDHAFCEKVWQALKGDHSDLRKQAMILEAHRTAVPDVEQVEVANAEIRRLRSLLIDPGSPAWEDARTILAAELGKAELPHFAQAVTDGEATMIPSWIALNLVGTALQAALASQLSNEEGEGA